VVKARLDYAHILVLTPNNEIVNQSLKFFMDGNKFLIKLVEEWGCNLGEDAFMMEVELDTKPEMLLQSNHVDRLDEVQGEWELDELVNDLHKEWSDHVVKKDMSNNSNASVSKNLVEKAQGADFFEVQLSPVLQPLSKPTTVEGDLCCANKQEGHEKQLKEPTTKGPLSFDWLSNQNQSPKVELSSRH